MKSKLENFWYYYKYHTLFGIFVLFVIVLVIVSCSEGEGDIELVLVDATAVVSGADADNLKSGFEEHMDFKGGSVVCRTKGSYVDSLTAERTGAESLEWALEKGNIDCIFVYRKNEIPKQYIGDINNVLPKELLEKLSGELQGYLTEDEEGNSIESSETAGIAVNDAKRFKECFGDIDAYIILQIPQNCKNKDNVAEFIKYLFDIS